LPLEDPSSPALVGFDPPWIVAGLLLIPYLVWGVYLLRLRLAEHVEIKPTVEIATVVAVIAYLGFQYFLLKTWLAPTPWKLLLATTALAISGAALYGHVVISLGSLLLVEMVMPAEVSAPQQPRYGAAEACERGGDFEGAAREYVAILRMFPKDATSALRAGDNLMKLDRFEEAVQHFEQGLALLESEERSLPVTNRLVEIYIRNLEQPEEARRVLGSFLDRFPQSERAEAVRARLQRIEEAPES